MGTTYDQVDNILVLHLSESRLSKKLDRTGILIAMGQMAVSWR